MDVPYANHQDQIENINIEIKLEMSWEKCGLLTKGLWLES